MGRRHVEETVRQFDAYQGETLTFEAALQSYGKPLAAPSEYAIYWQTNGMGSAWWVRPCTVVANTPIRQFDDSDDSTISNVLYATFSPDMDVGAKAYSCFIGLSNSIYRAAFQLRFRPSPGATPNLIEQPPRILDLAHTVVVNPPRPTDATISSRIRQVIDEDGITAPVSTNAVTDIISDTVDKAYVESLGISGGGSGGVDTNELRRVDDLAVYEKELSDWEYSGDPDVIAILKTCGFSYQYVEMYDQYIWELDKAPPTGWTEAGCFEPSDSLQLVWEMINSNDPDHDTSVRYATLTRKEILVPSQTNTIATTSAVAAAITNKADREELQPIATAAEEAKDAANEAKDAANEANVWSSSVYNFMTGGRTNCWFSGTNYVFGSDAATRQKFAWEDGMDAATVPCSMALWEIRDGARQLVWDQRDWTAWYWSFKAGQMAADIQGRIDALGNSVTNAANYAWSKRYASDGTPNPDASTTFIDTPSVTLSPGMKWETVATVSGAAYWTIVGNGAVIGGTGTDAVLRIMDFEGNDIMTVTKGEHRLAWLESGEITGNMYDEDRWVCFDMLADAEPVGYFSTTLDSSDFLPQTDPNCPAQYSWENIGGGKWRVHFLLKPGIQADACFAKFQVEIEGQTVIRYNAGQEISGGLIYNGVKIAPDVSGTPAVGTVIQWKVVR